MDSDLIAAVLSLSLRFVLKFDVVCRLGSRRRACCPQSRDSLWASRGDLRLLGLDLGRCRLGAFCLFVPRVFAYASLGRFLGCNFCRNTGICAFLNALILCVLECAPIGMVHR